MAPWWGRARAQRRRDRKSRKQVEGVAAVEEAAEVLERVNGLAGGQAGIAFDAMAKVGDVVVSLETERQVKDGIRAVSLDLGERRGNRRGSRNRGIPRQVHANQLDVCVRSRAEEMGRTGLQID